MSYRKVTIIMELTNDVTNTLPTDNEVHELLCKIMHEQDIEALQELHSYVTDIEVPDWANNKPENQPQD